MGGEQAANVLAQVKDEQLARLNQSWSDTERTEFMDKLRQQYETEGHPYYASARLWDDGIIEPTDTRNVLGLALSCCLNKDIEETKFGVFRM